MRTHSPLLTTLLIPVALFCIAGNSAAEEDAESALLSLETLLRDQAHSLRLEGARASGPGFEQLLAGAAESQFFIIAEEHNLLELNHLAGSWRHVDMLGVYGAVVSHRVLVDTVAVAGKNGHAVVEHRIGNQVIRTPLSNHPPCRNEAHLVWGVS